jgi:hypothetical protein
MSKYVRLLGAAALIALLATPAMARGVGYGYNGPSETPEQNMYRSARYDHLLQVSPSFRAYRMRTECNPINFVPTLRQDCLASFDQYEPVIAGGH